MHLEQIRDYCLNLKAVTEGCPFGPETLVFKVMDKMFLLISLDEIDTRFNAKCEPERAIALRAEHPETVLPGYHMSKVHWNTIVVQSHLPDSFYIEQINHSYQQVVASLPKKVRMAFES